MSAEIIELADAGQEDLDDYLEEQGWSDGLPVVPPTPERVAAMVAAVDRSGDHELGAMPPRQGIVTIEGVAITALTAT
ncbi:MAG: hypothetical protein AAFN30_09645, partial [Actinomycetota bacterium]